MQRVCMYSMAGLLVAGMFAYFFYRSLWVLPLLLPVSFEVMFYLDESVCDKKKRILKNEFREMILSIATNLKAGYSPENAFLETYADLLHLYGKNNRILCELETIKKGLSLNLPLEKLLLEFSKNSRLDEIGEFTDTFCLARKTGGNLAEIITSSASIISQKIEVDEEISVLTRAGLLERNIMMVIPFAIMLYIEMTNPDFFAPLYHNFIGICVMSVCLAVYLFSVKLSGKIINVRI